MKRLVPILLLMLLLTSCKVRVDSDVKVNEDETGTFSFAVSLDEEFRQLSEQDGGFEFTDGLDEVPAGWSVSEFVDGEFEGVVVSSDFTDFEDLDRKLRELEQAGDDATETGTPVFVGADSLRRDGDMFIFRSELTDLEEELGSAAAEGGDDAIFDIDPAQFLTDFFEIRLLLELPGTIGDNNADSVDGNVLTWNIGFTDSGRELRAESSLADSGGLPLGALAGVAALIAIVVIGIVVVRARDRRREQLNEGLFGSGLPGGPTVPPGEDAVTASAAASPPASTDPFTEA